jgi:3-oxoacyl-ACP reductase-like protein
VSTDTAQTTAASGATAMPGGASDPAAASASPADRPEVQVGAAFAGGFLVALILKRLGN